MLRLVRAAAWRLFFAAAAFCLMLALAMFGQSHVLRQKKYINVDFSQKKLPTAYVSGGGVLFNPMDSYTRNVGSGMACGCLSLLPKDRRLSFVVEPVDENVRSVSVQIRSVDSSRLVEKKTVQDWQQEDGAVRISYQPEDLLSKGCEYILTLSLKTGGEELYFFTRVMLSEDEDAYDRAMEYLDFAADFSDKALTKDDARSLVRYMETDENFSSTGFGEVTLKSSFDELTFGGLGPKLCGDKYITLEEFGKSSCQVEICYTAACSQDGSADLVYDIAEHFTLKKGSERMYVLDYRRTMDQVTTTMQSFFSGRRLMEGIRSEENISIKRNADGTRTGFEMNGDLWLLSLEDRRLVQVFSLRTQADGVLLPRSRRQDIKVLKVDENGSMEFAVFGRMGSGNREGENGLALYRYDAVVNELSELLFLPTVESFDDMSMDFGRLLCCGREDEIYFYLGRAIYGMDLKSLDPVCLAEDLDAEDLFVCRDESLLAWEDRDGQKTVFEPGTGVIKQLETAQDDSRLLGICGQDIVYGIRAGGNSGKAQMVYSELRIVDRDENLLKSYKKDGLLVSDVDVADGQIRFLLLDDASMEKAGQDTLIAGMAAPMPQETQTGWYADLVKKRVSFIQLDTDMKNGEDVALTSPGRMSVDTRTKTFEGVGYGVDAGSLYAFARGQLAVRTGDLNKTLDAVYDDMGYITDESRRVLISRAEKKDSVTLSGYEAAYEKLSEQEGSGMQVFVLRGLSLTRAEMFVSAGTPVIWQRGGREWVIYGYSRENVRIYHPDTGQTESLALEKAQELFKDGKAVCTVGIETGAQSAGG